MLRGDAHENAILTSADWALHTIQIPWLSQRNCWVISLEIEILEREREMKSGCERKWWMLNCLHRNEWCD